MKQLINQGLRKCYVCKKIFELNSKNFHRCKERPGGFGNACKGCKRLQSQHRTYPKDYWKKRYEKNKDRIRERNKSRRLRIRFNVLKKFNFTCHYCGRKSPNVILEIDHLYPKSKGGLNRESNYVVACKDCNRGKGDIILNEF